MATECYSQLGFGFQPKLVVDFAGGTLTTDAGLLLVREFDELSGRPFSLTSVRPQCLRPRPEQGGRLTPAGGHRDNPPS